MGKQSMVGPCSRETDERRNWKDIEKKKGYNLPKPQMPPPPINRDAMPSAKAAGKDAGFKAL
nr:hypothetical protein Itr_chr11CG25080 [Ipomoea trifida]